MSAKLITEDGQEWEFNRYNYVIEDGEIGITQSGNIHYGYGEFVPPQLAIFRPVPKRYRYPAEGYPALLFEETGEAAQVGGWYWNKRQGVPEVIYTISAQGNPDLYAVIRPAGYEPC